jgi:transcriptional regulator with XRE-family HTH domain
MQAIAGQLGINRDTWSRYETKGGMPTMAILRRVSKLTGKPSDYLRGE